MKKRKAGDQLTLSELFSKSKRNDAGASRSDSPERDVVDVEEAASEPVSVTSPSGQASSVPEAESRPTQFLNDIGEAFDLDKNCWSVPPSSLSEERKMNFILHHGFVPPEDFTFPVRTSQGNRKFQRDWLKNNPWLTYSPKCDGGFCLPCVLFPCGASQGQLTATPMQNFKKATTLFGKHPDQKGHKDSLAKFGQFKAIYVAGKADVADQLEDAHQLQARDNEEKLKSIIDCVLFCGRQCISLRGHRNEVLDNNAATDDANEEIRLIHKEDGNPGNFDD